MDSSISGLGSMRSPRITLETAATSLDRSLSPSIVVKHRPRHHAWQDICGCSVMVQKWAFGAMINMSGSIAINLGTNLMKLSHKMQGVELPAASTVSGNFASALQAAELEGGSKSNGTSLAHHRTLGESCRYHTSNASHQKQAKEMQEMEMIARFGTKSNGEATACQVASTSSADVDFRATGKTQPGRSSRDHAERARLQEDDHIVAETPASGTGLRVCSEDRIASLDRHRQGSRSFSSARDGRSGREPGLSDMDDRNKGGLRSEEASSVRRRSLSTNGDSANGRSISPGEPLEMYRVKEGSGVEARTEKPACKTRATWYTGAMLLVAGSLVNFASFGFAPQSLLASLGSVQFVSNVVFGKAILREVVTRRIIFGTATIILGNTLTLCFSPHQDDNYNTRQLKDFYDLQYNSVLFLELAVAVAMHAAYMAFQKSKEQGVHMQYLEVGMPLSYAICSAIIGTQSVIQAKCLSELVTMTFQGENQMASPFTYMVIIVWLGTTIFWLTRMNRALKMFHGLFIIPALQVFWTFFSVIGGGIYFEEFHSLTAAGALGFSVGVLVVFLGVYLLAPRTQTDHGRRGPRADREEGQLMGSDLRRMIEVEGEALLAPTLQNRSTSDSNNRCSREPSLEAGDEEIDWDHTRMLSLGFFPSISTDQDMGLLADALEAMEPQSVVKRLKAWKAEHQGDMHGRRRNRDEAEGQLSPRQLDELLRPGSPHTRSSRARDSGELGIRRPLSGDVEAAGQARAALQGTDGDSRQGGMMAWLTGARSGPTEHQSLKRRGDPL